jgi:hypothetical protein
MKEFLLFLDGVHVALRRTLMVAIACGVASLAAAQPRFGIPAVSDLSPTCSLGDVVIKTGANDGLYYCKSPRNPEPWAAVGGPAGGVPGGSGIDGAIQSNHPDGTFYGSTHFLWEDSSLAVQLPGASLVVGRQVDFSDGGLNDGSDPRAGSMLAGNGAFACGDTTTTNGCPTFFWNHQIHSENATDINGNYPVWLAQFDFNLGTDTDYFQTAAGFNAYWRHDNFGRFTATQANLNEWYSSAKVQTTVSYDEFAGALDGSTISQWLIGYHSSTPFTFSGGSVAADAAFFAEKRTASFGTDAIANKYAFWSDEQGVFRIKADNHLDAVYQAIPALYNPQYPKYTPGANAFERVVLGQFNGNVAEYGTEAGPTLTLSSVTRSGSTATATCSAACQYRNGDSILIAGANQTEYNGTITITVSGADTAVQQAETTFTYPVSGTPASPATGTVTATGGTLRPTRLIGAELDLGMLAGCTSGQTAPLVIGANKKVTQGSCS